jgi:hypothetical protein
MDVKTDDDCVYEDIEFVITEVPVMIQDACHDESNARIFKTITQYENLEYRVDPVDELDYLIPVLEDNDEYFHTYERVVYSNPQSDEQKFACQEPREDVSNSSSFNNWGSNASLITTIRETDDDDVYEDMEYVASKTIESFTNISSEDEKQKNFRVSLGRREEVLNFCYNWGSNASLVTMIDKNPSSIHDDNNVYEDIDYVAARKQTIKDQYSKILSAMNNQKQPEYIANYAELDFKQNTFPFIIGDCSTDCVYAEIDSEATKGLRKTKLVQEADRLAMLNAYRHASV